MQQKKGRLNMFSTIKTHPYQYQSSYKSARYTKFLARRWTTGVLRMRHNNSYRMINYVAFGLKSNSQNCLLITIIYNKLHKNNCVLLIGIANIHTRARKTRWGGRSPCHRKDPEMLAKRIHWKWEDGEIRFRTLASRSQTIDHTKKAASGSLVAWWEPKNDAF